MNHVSIFEKKWLDLVFEGKNKSYGAYKLRLENQRTTLMALLFGLLIIASAVSIGIVVSKLSKQQIPTFTDIPLDEPVTPVNLSDPPPPQEPQTHSAPPVVPDEDQPENTEQLHDPVIVPPIDATDVNLTTKPVVPETPTGSGTPGNNPTPGNPGSETLGTGIAPTSPNIAHLPATLDRMPDYPGGLKNFYKYIGDNFDKPEIDNVKSVSVIVSFVVERDGSISDVRVLRDPGYGMAKEALRVLKSLKVKWTPGYKNGQPVRTAYTLPITVNIN